MLIKDRKMYIDRFGRATNLLNDIYYCFQHLYPNFEFRKEEVTDDQVLDTWSMAEGVSETKLDFEEVKYLIHFAVAKYELVDDFPLYEKYGTLFKNAIQPMLDQKELEDKLRFLGYIK